MVKLNEGILIVLLIDGVKHFVRGAAPGLMLLRDFPARLQQSAFGKGVLNMIGDKHTVIKPNCSKSTSRKVKIYFIVIER